MLSIEWTYWENKKKNFWFCIMNNWKAIKIEYPLKYEIFDIDYVDKCITFKCNCQYEEWKSRLILPEVFSDCRRLNPIIMMNIKGKRCLNTIYQYTLI